MIKKNPVSFCSSILKELHSKILNALKVIPVAKIIAGISNKIFLKTGIKKDPALCIFKEGYFQ